MGKYSVFKVEKYEIYFYFIDGEYGEFIRNMHPYIPNFTSVHGVQRLDVDRIPERSHIHIYKEKNTLFAVKYNGTAHYDGNDYQLPDEVARFFRRYFRDLKIPENNRIQSLDKLHGRLPVDII